MTSVYPTSIDAFATHADGDIINPDFDNEQQEAITALETKVGVTNSAITTTLDYKTSEVTGGDKAVGKTATQTLTNKTLTSPVVNVGSDATGDMYYRNAGVLTRIPIGTDNQIMKLNGTTPNWEAEAATVDASTTVKGVVEAATAAELAAGTATGATGAVLVVTPDIVTFSEFGSGADGAITFDGTTTVLGIVPSSNIYTLNRDIYLTVGIVNSGATIETAGYRIFAKTSFANAGTVKRTPNNGGNASGITAGTAGTALASGTIYGGLAGVAGGVGVNSGGGNANGGNGVNGTAQTESIGVVGVAGGAGGASNGGASGGTAGTAGALTATVQHIYNVTFATIMREFQAEVLKYIKGPSGSGGGGGGGTSGVAVSGGGGGSGSTGGIVWIASKILTNTGTISALGGNGGAGANAASGQAGGGGGGGGGSGGSVILIYKSITIGTVTVTGGSAGTAGTGTGGGATGGSGTSGTTGTIIQIAC